jgi:hypothetical protein
MATTRALVTASALEVTRLLSPQAFRLAASTTLKKFVGTWERSSSQTPTVYFGLTNINVLGASGAELSARIGLSGKVLKIVLRLAMIESPHGHLTTSFLSSLQNAPN